MKQVIIYRRSYGGKEVIRGADGWVDQEVKTCQDKYPDCMIRMIPENSGITAMNAPATWKKFDELFPGNEWEPSNG